MLNLCLLQKFSHALIVNENPHFARGLEENEKGGGVLWSHSFRQELCRRRWADKHKFPYFNSDVVRKQLAGKKPTEPCGAGVGEGIYSPIFTRLTYDALVNFARQSLEDPLSSCVVLDGSYQSRAERERLQSSLASLASVVFVMCSCREQVVKMRLAQRAGDPLAVSDGQWDIYLQQKKNFEYPEELAFENFRRLDTDRELTLLLQTLDNIFLQEEKG